MNHTFESSLAGFLPHQGLFNTVNRSSPRLPDLIDRQPLPAASSETVLGPDSALEGLVFGVGVFDYGITAPQARAACRHCLDQGCAAARWITTRRTERSIRPPIFNSRSRKVAT